MTITVSEMRARNKAAGFHWFDRGAMAFFRSHIETRPDRQGFFITSEEFPSGQRLYSVRRFDCVTANVDTVGQFGQYQTREEALGALRDMRHAQGRQPR